MNLVRTLMIALAVLVHMPAIAADPAPSGDDPARADSAKLRAPVVMASVATDVPDLATRDGAAADSASDEAPKPKRRAARVTTCRCGDVSTQQ